MRNLSEKLRTSFERLSSREQGLILLLAVTLFLLIFGGTHLMSQSHFKKTTRRIAAKRNDLKEAMSLREDYQRRLRAQEKITDSVRGNAELRLLSYLDDVSKKASVELKDARPQSDEKTGSPQVKEEAATVTVKKVSLDRLHSFLKRIEEGNQLVLVRRLNIRRSFEDPEMLDATITVGTFKPTEESGT